MSGSPGFVVGAFWGPRVESAARITERWAALVARLKEIDPAFGEWFLWEGESRTLITPVEFAQCVLHYQLSDILGGCHFYLRSKPGPPPHPQVFSMCIHAGSLNHNFIVLNTDFDVVPDPRLITYYIFKSTILAVAEHFDVERAYAYPMLLMNFWAPQHDANPSFPLAWLSFVARRATPLVKPPATAILDHRPDGGLLMSATDQRFHVDNPTHMAVARDIEAATAPLHGHPWLQENEGTTS